MIIPQTITYRTVDGLELTYDLYLPQRAAKSPNGHPIVIWFHGGGLLQGSKINLPTHFKQLAEQEHDEPIAVLTPDYRLAPQVSLPDILQDIDALLAHVRSDAFSRNGIDVDRIALSGGSAGGYLALIAGLTASSTEYSEAYRGNNGKSGIKCLAPYYPITNLVDPFWTRKQSCPSWLKSPLVAVNLAC
jgi:acetyl esterase/lipase